MKTINILNRWTSAVLFSLDVADDDPNPVRTAVRAAIASGSNLRDSNLRDSNLSDSNLRGSNLSDSNLSDSDLSDSDLSDSNLSDSNLRGSDLSGSNLSGSNLSDSNLRGSNLRGSNLRGSNLRGSNLRDSNLSDSDLSDSDLSGSDLSGSDLSGSDLSGSNLSGSNLSDSNLSDSNLSDSNLSDSDLSGSVGASIESHPVTAEERAKLDEEKAIRRRDRALRYRADHPEIPVVENLDAKILALVDANPNALDMARWHTCETTHCRAGFSTTLAGDAGKALEKKLDPARAGMKIYLASVGYLPDFYCDNERAIADMREAARLHEIAFPKPNETPA